MMTKICCVCNRVEQGKSWTEHYLFAVDERVTHGYCPTCFDGVMTEIMEFTSKEQHMTAEVQPQCKALHTACA